MMTLRRLLAFALACLVFLAAMPGLERLRALQGPPAACPVLGLGWSMAERSEGPARSGKEAWSALEEDDEDADPSKLHKVPQPRLVTVQTGAVAHPHEVLFAQLAAARAPAALYLKHCLLLV